MSGDWEMNEVDVGGTPIILGESGGRMLQEQRRGMEMDGIWRDGWVRQSVISFGVKPYVSIFYVVYSVVVVVEHQSRVCVVWWGWRRKSVSGKVDLCRLDGEGSDQASDVKRPTKMTETANWTLHRSRCTDKNRRHLSSAWPFTPHEGPSLLPVLFSVNSVTGFRPYSSSYL